MLNNQDYQLYPLTAKDLQEVLQFISTHYVANESLLIHIGFQSKQFSQTYQKLTLKCCSSGLSFCFRFSQEMVAVILAIPLQGYLEPIGVPTKLQPFQSIIQTIEKMYEPQHPEKTLSIFIGCTRPDHMRKGLFTRLLQQTQKKTIQKGYIQIYAECTSKKSENAFSKQGYQEKAWICYENFEFNGQYPFKGIKNAERVCAMTKNINQKIKQ